MDDNGESYWIFESRDVRIHLFKHLFTVLNERPLSSLHGLPIPLTLGEASLQILNCLLRNLTYFEILLDGTIRLPGPLAWPVFRLRAQV